MKVRFFTLAVLISISSIAVSAPAVTKTKLRHNLPPGPAALDGTHMLGVLEQMTRSEAVFSQALRTFSLNYFSYENEAFEGQEITVEIYDFFEETTYEQSFTITAIGEHGIILVSTEAYEGFDGTNYTFENPYGDGEDRFTRMEDTISHEQLEYMLNEFDTVIYPKDTEVFGEPAPRGAEGLKTWILIHNIRDEAYYLPDEQSYVAGYFSSYEDTVNDKNMMHIDTYDWSNRVGSNAENPYMYEGTFAHEFQHLIHFDRDPDEPSWVDEGCADLAGYICGYGHPAGHIAYYMAYHPITSLTYWGGELENYGASYLFALYLYEQFGGESFIRELVSEEANGIEGIENTLANNGYKISFNNVFDNWTLANYLDSPTTSNGKFGYSSLEIGSDDTYGFTIETALREIWEKLPADGTFEISSSWTGIEPLPYTAHYHTFNNDRIARVTADGDDYAGITAYSGKYQWHSGSGPWHWDEFGRTFEIPASGATLGFFTYYEIEEDWDYAYVEVYDYDTGEWHTIEAPGLTLSTLPNIQDNPNVPDELEPSTYLENGRWHAFTGESGGWVEVSMDLAQFSGHRIDIYFRTWQDGAFDLQMMYVDDISIKEIDFFDDVESEDSEWFSEGWTRTDGRLDNGFSITTIGTFTLPESSSNANRDILYSVKRMKIDSETQGGSSILLPAPSKMSLNHVSIITNHAEHNMPTGYNIKVEPFRLW